jgi:transcriptional regulator with PAS, ATPase and Fis domain
LSDLPALITGETGTGKELLAHAIHLLDPKRCQGPFIAVNCAALSSTLAESELFGHRRGTFTGAERDRKGLIRAADGGVLFLDEIGDLALDLQPKLLRVLQEYTVLTLGEEEEVSVNVRVVAATNQDLRELTRLHKFRADLFQRLNVLHVRVPPLSERPSDIEPLARHFLAKHRALRVSEHLEIAPEFFEALAALDLPGNVRQLENLVRQALVSIKSGMPLALSDLPEEIWTHLSRSENASLPPKVQSPQPNHGHQEVASEPGSENLPMWEGLLQAHRGNLANCLKACERSLLTAVFRRAQGNQSQMARVLGITARSVYSKIRKYDLSS